MTPLQQAMMHEVYHHPGITFQQLIAKVTTGTLEKTHKGREVSQALTSLINDDLADFDIFSERITLTTAGMMARQELII